MEGALGGIDAPLKPGEFVRGVVVGAGEVSLSIGSEEGADLELHESGFDGAEAAKEPFIIDENIDERALLGGAGLEAVDVLGGEGGEFLGGFAFDDLGAGINAGFEGIEAGNGLALDRARAGG